MLAAFVDELTVIAILTADPFDGVNSIFLTVVLFVKANVFPDRVPSVDPATLVPSDFVIYKVDAFPFKGKFIPVEAANSTIVLTAGIPEGVAITEPLTVTVLASKSISVASPLGENPKE